jgi:hypothetical protein
MMNQSNAQRDMIARCRSESCLDSKVPLGMAPASRPEFGPTVAEFFRRKHATQAPGNIRGFISSLPCRGGSNHKEDQKMFKKHNQTPERYDEDALRRDVFAALERARQARIHSVVIQRVIHGVADSEAQRRAVSEAVI